MDFTDIETYITTEYRTFSKNQFLEHQQFNELLYYLDSQEKYTRMTSIGSGILCGFQPKTYYSRQNLFALSLSQGLGVTSDGTLMYFSQLIKDAFQDSDFPKANFNIDKKIFTHYKVYDDYKVEPKYLPFYEYESVVLKQEDVKYPVTHIASEQPLYKNSDYEGNEDVEGYIVGEPIIFYELGTTEDAKENTKFQSLTNLNANEELFIVLYNETYDQIDEPCIGVNCDQPAAVHLQNTKVLLTNQEGIDTLVKNDLAYQKYNLTVLCSKLKTVNLKRPILNKSMSSLLSIRNLYRSFTLDVTLLNALEFNYQAIAQYFGMESELTRNKLQGLVTAMFANDATFSFQYAYSFIKDLVVTYKEIKELLSKHIATNDPTLNTFKNHLMLGSLQNPSEEYRHGFYASSALDNENIEARIQFLISKSNQMLARFVPPISKGGNTYYGYGYYGSAVPYGVKDIKVTESSYYGELETKAIPWYYEFKGVDSFVKNWSYNLYTKKQAAQNKSYITTNLTIAGGGIIRSQDKNIWDKKDLFRIEGIQGQNYETVKSQLEDIKELHQLSFSVIMLSLTELESTEDTNKVYFPDFVEKNPGLAHLGGVPEGGTLALVYQSEDNPQVIADFGTPFSCCNPKIATILGIPVDEICQWDEPIPLEISPADGVLIADVGAGLNGGIIGNAENGYKFNPSIVSEQLLGKELKFRINDKAVAATLTVLPAPTITEIKIVNVSYSEVDSNDAQVTFAILGTNLSAYTYEWDFYGDGNYRSQSPDRNNNVIVDYKFTAEVAEINAKVRIKGTNGCPLEKDINALLNRIPNIDGNNIALDISSAFVPLAYGDVVHNFTDPDKDQIAKINVLEKTSNLNLQVNATPVVLDKPYVANPEPVFQVKYNSAMSDPLYLPKNGVNAKGNCEAEIIEIDRTSYEEIKDTHNVITLDNGVANNRKAIFQKIDNTIEELPNDTIIYIHIDTTSMATTDRLSIANLTSEWWETFRVSNPSFAGVLIINTVAGVYNASQNVSSPATTAHIPGATMTGISADIERWLINPIQGLLRYGKELGGATYASEDDLLQQFPQRSLVVLSFIDETNSGYHNASVGFNQTTAMQTNYSNDYSDFLSLRKKLSFFKGVLYPITRTGDPKSNDSLLHSIAAINPTTLSANQIDNLLGDAKKNIYGANMETYFYANLRNSNPYRAYPALASNGWEGRFDKYSPASAVLSSGEFAAELNKILTDTSTVQITTPILEELPINNLGTKVSTDFVLNVTDDNTLGGAKSNNALIAVDFTLPCEANIPVLPGTIREIYVNYTSGLEDEYIIQKSDLDFNDTNITKIRVEEVLFSAINTELKINNLVISNANNSVPSVITLEAILNGELSFLKKPEHVRPANGFVFEFTYTVAKDSSVNFSNYASRNTIKIYLNNKIVTPYYGYNTGDSNNYGINTQSIIGRI